MKQSWSAFLGFVVAVLLVSCSEPSGQKKYASLVKQELAKGVRRDSIFLGIYLGMTSKDFYGHCWSLNKQGIIRDGKNNTMVNYKMDTGLKYPAEMNFYPDFEDNKIFKMRVEFQYSGWAPWNKTHYADSLLPEVVSLYRRWYPAGNDFFTLSDSLRGTIYVKVDGNRRITIGKYNDMLVKADFTDLLVEQKQKR